MSIEEILKITTILFGGGFVITLIQLWANRRRSKAETRGIEVDIEEKEVEVEHKRADRAWARANTVEERIEQLEADLDRFRADLLKVKEELKKEQLSHLDTKFKLEKLKKKVKFECTCLNINWEDYE